MEHAGMVRMFKYREDTWLKGSFYMVTSENFDLMVTITVGLKVNWAQVLFQVLVAMVNNPTRQSQGFAMQLSVVLERLVKADLRESVKHHPYKVLTDKSMQTYIKKNLTIGPAGETSKASGATDNEHQSTADSIPSKRSEREAGEKNKTEKKAVEKKKKKRRYHICSAGASNKKKHRTKRAKKVPNTVDHHVESHPGSILEIPTRGDEGSGGPVDTIATPLELEKQDGDGSNIPEQDENMKNGNETSNAVGQDERMECKHEQDKEGQDGHVSTIAQGERDKSTAGGPEGLMENEGLIVTLEQIEQEEWHESDQPAQRPTPYTGKDVLAPMEIQEINWVTHFLPNIDPNDKGKGVLPHLDRKNPIEEHYLLVIQNMREQT
ncbi:hypothetical protein F511_37048 [Dorcoceras hygrometricum]|uniref:Uncharacterized protein n=1 Tax=Dorcoceras hygrometricum TaxID=472368 RepID=A0A2Z7AH50_9LAMI|nr:hypothetical protein F511_37048 [Dorcoceras hygrometricum]